MFISSKENYLKQLTSILTVGGWVTKRQIPKCRMDKTSKGQIFEKKDIEENQNFLKE